MPILCCKLHNPTLSESLSKPVTSNLSACSHGGHWMPHARCLRCAGQLSSSSSSACGHRHRHICCLQQRRRQRHDMSYDVMCTTSSCSVGCCFKLPSFLSTCFFCQVLTSVSVCLVRPVVLQTSQWSPRHAFECMQHGQVAKYHDMLCHRPARRDDKSQRGPGSVMKSVT